MRVQGSDLPQKLAAIVVVGCLVELEVPAVAEERPEFGRQPLA